MIYTYDTKIQYKTLKYNWLRCTKSGCDSKRTLLIIFVRGLHLRVTTLKGFYPTTTPNQKLREQFLRQEKFNIKFVKLWRQSGNYDSSTKDLLCSEFRVVSYFCYIVSWCFLGSHFLIYTLLVAPPLLKCSSLSIR